MKNPVRNLVALGAPDPESAAAARAAVLALARAKDPDGAAESGDRIAFTIDWEPAFKDVKEISAKFPAVTFTLYGDAFAKMHWISKAVYQSGKLSEEATLSRIDGASFRALYLEIFGEAFPIGG